MVKNNRMLVLIGIGIIFLDQLTKHLLKSLSLNTTGHVVDITLTKNTGSLFSLFAGTSFINIIFILLSLVAIGVLYYILKSEKNNLKRISYTIIISGILGNLIDRILLGGVIDWINFHFWPIFNIADSSLFIGVALAIIALIREKE